MKHVLLVRHAKSDWGDPSLSDFDRPLNGRGKRDAPVMAQRLLDKKISIDGYYASPAKRAAKTAKIFAENLGFKKNKICLKEELYLADTDVFMEVITQADNSFTTIALFSHNPGITDFANQLTETRIDNIPTSAIFAVSVECDKWKDFKNAKKSFWFFDYPKATTV